MTESVTEQTASGSESDPPILLMLNCSSSAPYLGGNNPDLVALFGVRLVRIAVEVPYFYLSPELAMDKVLELADASDEKPSVIRRNLESADWLKGQLQAITAHLFLQRAERRDPPLKPWAIDRVRLVIVDRWMVEQGPLLMEVLPQIFRFAEFRMISTSYQDAKTERIA